MLRCEVCQTAIQAGTRCTDCGARSMTYTGQTIAFPEYSGIRCLMMPYIQGDPLSVPSMYDAYRRIIASVFIRKGDIGYLTIDESPVTAGKPHRGQRAAHGRAIHTEAGKGPTGAYGWGGPTPGWGGPDSVTGRHTVTLDRDVQILLANSLDETCAIWNTEHEDTSINGDIGHVANMYPYEAGILMRVGDVHKIGILTPHESLPVRVSGNRQFLRIVSSGVHGREEYFTRNSLVAQQP